MKPRIALHPTLAAFCALACLLVAPLAAEPPGPELLRAKLEALHARWKALGGTSCVRSVTNYTWNASIMGKKKPAGGPPYLFYEMPERYYRSQGDNHVRPVFDAETASRENREFISRRWNSKGELAYSYREPFPMTGGAIPWWMQFGCLSSEAFGALSGPFGPGPFGDISQAQAEDDEGTRWYFHPVGGTLPAGEICCEVRLDPESGLVEEVSGYLRGRLYFSRSYRYLWHEQVGEHLPVLEFNSSYRSDARGAAHRDGGLDMLNISVSNAWSTGHNDAPEAYGWPAFGIDPLKAENLRVSFWTRSTTASSLLASGQDPSRPYLLHHGRLIRGRLSLTDTYSDLFERAASDPTVLLTSPWSITPLVMALAVLVLVIRASLKPKESGDGRAR